MQTLAAQFDAFVEASELVATDDEHWVVVSFFAPWCPPCLQEQPELRRFVDRHAEARDVRVVSVVVQSQRSEIAGYLADHRPGWSVIDDADGATSVAYGLLKLPESYVVAPDGVVAAKLAGAVTADQLDGVLSAAAGGR